MNQFSRNARQGAHHGTALGGELREATGLDVGPAPPEHKAHGVHRPPPPPLPPGVRWAPPKRRLPAPRGNKTSTSPRSKAAEAEKDTENTNQTSVGKRRPNRNCNFRNPGGPDAENARNPGASGSFADRKARDFRAQSVEKGADSPGGARFREART